MNFLQLPTPKIDVPADSVVLNKIGNRFNELIHMSWDDLSRTLVTDAMKIGGKLLAAIAVFIVGRWLIKKIDKLIDKLFEKRGVDRSLNAFVRNMLKIVEWIFLLMILVSILGIRTTSFLAILASLAFAIGMALSGTLQNFAGGVLILFLKPFRTGDYIIAQGQEGTVQEINLFNTVLITPDNKTIIIPNGGMSTSIVNNTSETGTRRVEWTFGISYGDSYEDAKKVLEELIRSESRILDSPSYSIALSNLADSAVQIVVRAWTATSDFWSVYYDMNEKVYKMFPEHGLTIPFNQLDVNLTTKILPQEDGVSAK